MKHSEIYQTVHVTCCTILAGIMANQMYMSVKYKRKPRIANTLKTFAILASLLMAVRLTLTGRIVWKKTPDTRACHTYITASVAAFAVTQTVVYAFSWVKHYLLYRSPIMQRTIHTAMKIVSAMTIILIESVTLGCSVVYLLPRVSSVMYISNQGMCQYVEGKPQHNDLPHITYFSGVLLVQTTLLVLNTYPLIKHMLNTNLTCQSARRNNTRILYKMTALAMCAGVNDTIAFLAQIMIDAQPTFYLLVWDVNIIVHQILTAVTYQNITHCVTCRSNKLHNDMEDMYQVPQRVLEYYEVDLARHLRTSLNPIQQQDDEFEFFYLTDDDKDFNINAVHSTDKCFPVHSLPKASNTDDANLKTEAM